MNIYRKKEKNNSNQLVIEKLTDLLKIPPDKLKKAQYSDFSGKYFDQIIDEVIKSEKKPKNENIIQNKQTNYNYINKNNSPNINNENKIILNDDKIKNEEEKKINISNNSNEFKNYNQNYIPQYQSIDSSFSQKSKIGVKHNINSPVIVYDNYNDNNYPIKKIVFIIYYNTVFGQEIAISGSNDKLGNWNKNKLFYLEWSQGNKWIGELDIDELEDFEFKFVVCYNKEIISWEPGENNNVYFTALFNEIKEYPKGRYNKYQYEYNRENGQLVLNCRWPS